MVSDPALELALVSVGKFCRSFGPLSASEPSLFVRPSEFRSISYVSFKKIELPKISLAVVAFPVTLTPRPTLKAMMLGSPNTSSPELRTKLPPIRVLVAPSAT